MNPILSGGGFFPTYAWSHSIALGSRHIGSLPGELGSSGTQVQSLLPLRSTFMLPSSLISAIVAVRDTLGGAAVMAFAIFAASVFGAFQSAAWVTAPSRAKAGIDRSNAGKVAFIGASPCH